MAGPNNKNAYKHGAGAAERALTTGEPLKDQAALVEQNVENELAQDGVDTLLKRGAIRLQAVADMYFAAMLTTQDLGRLDQLAARWGWLQNSAYRAWTALKQGNAKGKHDAARVIAAIREAGNETDE